ncbi:hypothetical protein HPULCUR_009827 [Helicostylum pulchrum]|uniref:RAVE complex protein Rav1 C-terminal domain-containing protein n=1 Tax=Helicostylum pulchrum TaxID=562976 RepID=A0ABP9YBK2_9FUNG
MFLEQICPGQVNTHLHAIHTFIYKNEQFIVYATGSKVVIYADPDNLVQIIAASTLFHQQDILEPVTAVSGNNKTGQIALSYHNQIAVLKPCDGNEHRWELDTVLDTSYVITCLDWSVNNLLLSAGKEILLWDNTTWNIICSKKPATDILLAKFEPKSNKFATVGKFDRLVTIWYPNATEEVEDYSFTFISHPKYVTHFVWRKLPGTQENDCTLFTMARDGIGRFWSPINLDQSHILYMCAVIDSNQSLVTSEPAEEQAHIVHNVASTMMGEDSIEEEEDDDYSPIHYIGCDELSNAVHAQFKSHSKHERFDQRLERIRERVRDTPDLLFRIQSDGSLTFWGVQHLNTFPRRIPRVFVVLRVDKAVDPLDVIYFLNPTQILHDYAHIQSSSTIKPIELSLVARNPHGQLRCYSLNLVDFLDTTPFTPRLHLKYTWLGHQHAISKLYQSQKNRFCTIGIDGQINVWKYELRETCGKMTTQLQLDCSLYVNSNQLLAVPVEKDKFLAVYDGVQVKLFEFDNIQDCHLHHSKVCVNSTSLDLTSLHVYNMEDPITSEKSYLLIGVSNTHQTITTWYLEPTEGGGLEINYRGSQQMTSWTSDPHVVVSASQWATNTASRLFHRLSFQQKHVLTVTVGTDVICYGVNTEQETVEWEAIYTLDTSDLNGQIQQVRCSPSIVSIVSGTDDNQTLSIWMEMRSNLAPVCVKKFKFKQRVCDMAWNVTSDAQFILAVAFPNTVGIFGQKRAKSVTEDDDSWICYTEFKVDTPEDITALAWVDCGVLTVAAGNQLRCYLKWLTEEDSVAKQIHSPENAKIEPMSSIFDISFEMNGPLPFYHPDHIIHYVMWGKMDLVHCALISLNNFFKQFVDDDDNIINEFPPVSFPKMLKLQNEKKLKSSDKQQYTGLFDEESDTEILDNNDVDDDDDIVRHLTANEAKNLAHSLKTKVLPGLNENERVHLIAMVDTIVEITNQGESLDENGARFTALLENHFHLNKALPQDQRQADLQSCDFVWALHSQSQDLLLERCVRLCGTKFVWEDARSLGIFLWLQKIDVVREQMSNIARNIYLSKTDDRDPADCTLFYLALRKKNLLQGLWRSASSHKEQTIMKKFLANDFNEPRWQRAASKNAFALLGRQRFEYAASFFLLADKLRDAVNVILKNMKDYQLAIAICRVYDGDDSPLLKEILENSIIPMAIETNDRWLISIGFWLLNNQKDSVRAMVVPLSQFTDKLIDTTEKDSAEIVYNPNSFILYQYLKKKLRQQNLVVSYQTEYGFSLLVSRSYERLGLPLLALYILTKYYMKPPTTAAIKQEVELETAQNLFNSEPVSTTPSYATDLFADDKPSRASDLFANDDTDLFAPSKATDLFADDDLFAPKKPSGGLFDDDDDDLFAPKNTSSGLFDNDEKDLFGSETRPESSNADTDGDEISLSERCYDGLDGYKALLVIRMLQTFFHAASALYNGLDTPDHVHEIRYRSHFLRNRQALLDLGESVKVSPYVFSRLLMEKSIETDVFPLYLYILNESVPKDFDVHQFLRAFKVGCFEVNEVALMPQELDYSTLIFVENWTEHVIKTFPIWNELRRKYCNPETAALTSRQIALTTYLSLILITLKERHYESCWPLLFHFKFFLEALGSNGSDTAINNCLNQILKNETKMIEMSTDDFESFSDGSLFGFDMNEEVYRPLLDSQDKSTGVNILEVASLNYVLSAIEYAMQCQGKHGNLCEQLTDFIWTTLLDPVAYRAHRLNETIKKQLDNDLTRHNISKQFRTLRQKKYWRSLKSLSPPERLLPFIKISPSTVNVLEDDQNTQSHSVYHSSSTVYAFSLNSASRDSMAICMKSEIQEIDLSKAGNFGAPLFRSRSVSSSGLGHDHHYDSYPDTDEDDSDSTDEHDSIHTNTTMKQIQTRKKLPPTASSRVSGTSSPLVSPAGSRTFDEHVQKVPQNLNLDHLHDSLRRSLTKGSDYARTPVNASPSNVDNAEREKMILLRRNISATCAETHPQYPFYITGCEVNNGGPSAILWQFGQEREIASYYGCQGKTTRIHFDHFGQKFGAGDTSGNLCLWRFDAHAHSNKPYYTLNCHSKATRDFTFVNSSSLVATAGTTVTMSRKRDHVSLWDTLLPPSKAMVCSLPGHDGGAYAITYEPNSQLLFSGGKKGEIVVSDIRQRTTMHTFTAHQSRIRSISIDTENKALITGSIDGELKIWDVSTYKVRQSFDIQPRNRFLAPSFNRIPLKAFGVTQIQAMDDGNIYTSGPNGIIKCNLNVNV